MDLLRLNSSSNEKTIFSLEVHMLERNNSLPIQAEVVALARGTYPKEEREILKKTARFF
jgi:hypothetical protein